MGPWGVVDVIQPGVGRRPWAVEIEHVACGRNLRKIKNAEVMLIRVLLAWIRREVGGGRGGWRLDSVWWW